MHKELNPELFGESSVNRTRVVDGNAASGMAHQQVLQVDQKLAEMRVQNHSVIEQMNRLTKQMNDFIRMSQSRFEKMQAAIEQLQSQDQTLILENNQKLNQLNQKLGERKSLDLKAQEMIDRHNNVLKSYELRLSQLQKLIVEREQQIVACTAALNDAKMEISRLKRF